MSRHPTQQPGNIAADRVIAIYLAPPKPDPRDAEITRLRSALEQVRDHCNNAGRFNPAVADRIIDRCEETAVTALTAKVKP